VPLPARDRYSSDPQAYDDYLKGLRASYRDILEPLESAAELFSRAVQRDSEFALATLCSLTPPSHFISVTTGVALG
jgi:hypothetical protein